MTKKESEEDKGQTCLLCGSEEVIYLGDGDFSCDDCGGVFELW